MESPLECDEDVTNYGWEFDEEEEEVSKAQSAMHEEELKELVRREARAVHIWRIVTFSCMTIAAALVSGGVFFFLRNNQTRDFENGFEANALQLVESFNNKAAQKLEVLNPFATAYTSYARSRNLTFPFVTLPHFAYRASDAQVLGKDVQVIFVPLVVDNATRFQWEDDYALHNRFHVEQDHDIEITNIAKQDAIYRRKEDAQRRLQASAPVQEEDCTAASVNNCSTIDTFDSNSSSLEAGLQTNSTSNNATNATNNILPFELEDGYRTRIYARGLPVPYDEAPYSAVWQFSPVVEDRMMPPLNENIMGPLKRTPIGTAVYENHKAAIAPFYVPRAVGNGPARYTADLAQSQFRYDLKEFLVQPISFMIVPVFDGFDENKTIVGVMLSSVYWRVNFIHVLPSDAVGYICVLKHSFGQTVTFRVEGATNVTFLGEGDKHDSTYDDQVISSNINQFVNKRVSPRTLAYTSAPLDQEFGVVKIFVYPSKETEDSYRDSTPIWTAVAMAAIFLVTMIAFFLYDYLIESKQSLIMDRAIKASAIVESLFPKQVHARLFQPMDMHSDNNPGWGHRISIFPMDGSQTSVNKQGQGQTRRASLEQARATSVVGLTQSEPIADAYPNTTILFTYIAGFNEWSSKRTPRDVFLFLESMFGSFDELADKRKIFKVETIGDSYLAATGVPEPQDDHEVRMAKFAQALVHKAAQTIAAFSNEDDNLQIRVGINSGPITAGLLRGQKSRFQIFGDTVNTASRMASTGVGGRIQLSTSTADGLHRAGYSEWLQVRENKVHAKGKGYLTTYWMNPFRSNSATSSAVLGQSLKIDCIVEEDETLLVEYFRGSHHQVSIKSSRDLSESSSFKLSGQNSRGEISLPPLRSALSFQGSLQEIKEASESDLSEIDV